MSNNTASTIGSISTISSNLRDKVMALNAKLNDKHLPSLHEDRDSILQYISTHRDDHYFVTEIHSTLISTVEACDQITKLNCNHHQIWLDEKNKEMEIQSRSLIHERAKRRAERADMWWLWLHQTARWLAGAALVFFTYSSAVWLSERYPKFFHVPIKDWFSKVADQPKT